MWCWRECVGGCGRVANIGKQVHIRKVKLLKQPKFDLGSLMALHGESSTDDQGQKVEREFKETVLEQV
jgi:small subunit ribosomal protein S3Ae